MGYRLGQLETQFFAFIQWMQLKTVKTGDLQKGLSLDADQERKLLSRLSKAGLIARVQRGLYLVPEQLPLGGQWTPDIAAALDALLESSGGRYQICGPNAFNYYGWDEQVPNRTYVYNDRISGERKVGALILELIKVDRKRLGGTEKNKAYAGTTVYSSQTRALVDAVYDWARFNTLPRAYGWIRQDLRERRIDPKGFIDCTLRFGDIGTIRRIGVLLESEGTEERLLRKLETRLRPSTGFIPLVPGKPKRGELNKRWQVILNETA